MSRYTFTKAHCTRELNDIIEDIQTQRILSSCERQDLSLKDIQRRLREVRSFIQEQLARETAEK